MVLTLMIHSFGALVFYNTQLTKNSNKNSSLCSSLVAQHSVPLWLSEAPDESLLTSLLFQLLCNTAPLTETRDHALMRSLL
jgi:hypothetical protein